MTIRKENVLEKLKRLEEESSVIRYEERKQQEEINKEVRLKELDREIQRYRVDAEVKKTALTHRWTTVMTVIKDLIHLPVRLLFIPIIFLLLIIRREVPDWLKEIYKRN